MKKLEKINLFDIIEYFIAIIILLDFNSAYTRIINYNFHIKEISVFACILFLIVVLRKIDRVKKANLSKILVLIFLFFLFMILKVRTAVFIYIIKYIVLFVSLLLLNENKVEFFCFLKKMANVVFFISLLSLFFYIFGSLMHIIPSKSVWINWGGINLRKSYFLLHFDTQIEPFLGLNIVRNSGVYTEAPMYAGVLLFSLIIELFMEYRNKKHIVVLTVTIFSTLSLTGMASALILFLLDFFKSKNIKLIYKFFIFPIFLFAVLFSVNYMIDNKIKNNSNSYSARTDDYKASYNAWKENKLFGNGFENTEVTVKHMEARRRNNPGQSNAVGRYFSEGGLYFAAIVLFPYFVLYLKGLRYGKNNYILFSIGMIFALCTINVPYQMFTIVMLSICYNHI